MKNQIQNLITYLARRIIRKHKPKIIGITGSVGKTSAKEAVFAVVSKRYRAYRPLKNFNNEFGLPFAIVGVDSPARSVGKWLVVLARAFRLAFFGGRYPEVLVLEYGIDHPGDMDHLLSIAVPDIAVVTAIGVAHYTFFHDETGIAQEKGKLVEALSISGVAVLNADNSGALQLREKAKGTVVTYGVNNTGADVRLSDVQEAYSGNPVTTFTAALSGNKKIISTINALGTTHTSAIAAALAVADALKIDNDSILKGLETYKPAVGRLNVIGGIKRTTIIDDTYNASPDSMREALVLLERVPAEIKMAVLGDMLELGEISDEAHKQIGIAVAKLNLNHFVTVGPSGKLMADAARGAGMPADKILSFDSSPQAQATVQQILKPNSLVLIKGSQGMRMEKITKEIMAEPMRARELLCRQYGNWLEN